MVSDRAAALVQLGNQNYFGVCSMPDLFHFNQSMARTAGALIGRVWKKAFKTYKEASGYYSQRKPFEDNWLWADICRRKYRNGIHLIHKAIHPFDEQGQLKSAARIRRGIAKGIIQIEKQAINLGGDLPDKSRMKTFDQIPSILEGVEQWQDWLIERLEKLLQASSFKDKELLKEWLINYLIPFRYWLVILKRTTGKKRNKGLVLHYRKLIKKSKINWQNHQMTKSLSDSQINFYAKWADRIVTTFQRSSSQVEGRNGYLAFVHKANRGLPLQRLQVLTVVHNFDIRREDGTTPAERLFDQNFPDLFEFILLNVTGFPEPRKVKNKSPDS